MILVNSVTHVGGGEFGVSCLTDGSCLAIETALLGTKGGLTFGG